MEISIGDKIEFKGMVMAITGEDLKYFNGHYEYKGKKAGACKILKDTLINPHYTKRMKKL